MLALIRIPVALTYFLVISVFILLFCICRPFHRNNVHFAGQLYSKMAWFLGVKMVFKIPDSVKHGGPIVFIGNHQNTFDIFTVCGAAQPGTVSVGKKSLKWIPLFGQVYWLTGNILIDRKNTTKARGTLEQTIDKIKEKRISVWLFPEGTRSKGRGLLPFKTGAFRIAKETDEPVSMICCSNLHDKIKFNRWNNGTVLVEVTDPQPLDDSKNIKEWSLHFHHQMQQKITELDQQVLELEKAS